jgi:hypothetical protein
MQAEIDSVCSGERLPTFEDRTHLPYTDAVLVEVMRLTPPLPLGQYCIIPIDSRVPSHTVIL